jgi:outer membrane receptor protein involved in Fe transport
MKKFAFFNFILLSLFIFATAASAQQANTASLAGTVTDPNGAVIPGATVTVTQKATGFTRTTTTNGEGLYVLTNLPPGDYEVKVEENGFATKVSEHPVTLQVGQTVTLNPELAVGPGGETTVDLVAEAPLVDTDTSKVDSVIGTREIDRLPLNGRNFLELALLVPGNSPTPAFDPTKVNTVNLSSAGQLGRGGNVTIDGGDNNDDAVGGTLQNISQDAVQEFQIATNRFSAELGRSGSSVINVVTKGGTNEFHGSASFYERDRRLQGLPATFDRSSGQEPPFDRQQYSVALGGPLVKDKAFWFGSFEYRNQDGAVLVGTRDVAARVIRRTFAIAPLNDLMGTMRVDVIPTAYDALNFRYSIQREDDVSASKLDRQIGSASQRQAGRNRFHTFLANWTRTFSPTVVNSLSFNLNNFYNRTTPVTPGPQLTFPTIADGASFRVPQQTTQNRLQFGDTLTWIRGNHVLKVGAEFQKIDAEFDLEVFQGGRIELVQDFADFDHNNDGVINDNDLLFAVTLRSTTPDRALLLPDSDNNHFAFFVQDDWRVRRNLTFNFGLRYEVDTDVKNVSRIGEINPLVRPFLVGDRHRDNNNFGPRVGFNWSNNAGTFSVHGGYGIYYDRVTLELQSLERGLDGRSLAIAVRAGNAFGPPGPPVYLDGMGHFVPGAPTITNSFTGFVLPGAGASGINIIDNGLQNPMVQQSNLGVQWSFSRDYVLRADVVHNFGTHFIIGRNIGVVNNPVVGGPDRVVNLESSVRTKYDGLLVSVEKRFANRYQFRIGYALSKAFNYANDDQIPFSSGPINSNNLQLEYGPTPNDQRHRLTFAGSFDLPYGFRLAPIMTFASGVPMDILLPDASSRVPLFQRNAGGRLFKNVSELNAFLAAYNAGVPVANRLPLAPANARFSDNFSSVDMRLSKTFKFGDRIRLEPMVEVFNLFNTTNVLGVSNSNYSGFSNVLGSSNFGQPVTTAGGVFGSGGPRAFQFAARFSF